MSLFIKQIADKFAGLISFSLPNCNGGYVNVAGFLTEDPVIKMANKWESLIPDLNTINDFSTLSNYGASSWVATSKMAWKGTDPITINVNFYLITYLKAQADGTGSGTSTPISKQAAYFAQLLAISRNDGSDGFLKDLHINVHGGYKPNYFEANEHIVNNGGFLSSVWNDKNQDGTHKQAIAYRDVDDGTNTCQIVINGNGKPTLTLTKMLLESCDFTPSTVKAGYWVGTTFRPSPEPLYIKVNASFKLMHAATVSDAVRLFTGGTSL